MAILDLCDNLAKFHTQECGSLDHVYHRGVLASDPI
jgi:hypothetical protein